MKGKRVRNLLVGNLNEGVRVWIESGSDHPDLGTRNEGTDRTNPDAKCHTDRVPVDPNSLTLRLSGVKGEEVGP